MENNWSLSKKNFFFNFREKNFKNCNFSRVVRETSDKRNIQLRYISENKKINFEARQNSQKNLQYKFIQIMGNDVSFPGDLSANCE